MTERLTCGERCDPVSLEVGNSQGAWLIDQAREKVFRSSFSLIQAGGLKTSEIGRSLLGERIRRRTPRARCPTEFSELLQVHAKQAKHLGCAGLSTCQRKQDVEMVRLFQAPIRG
jgi:hypothetical protein